AGPDVGVSTTRPVTSARYWRGLLTCVAAIDGSRVFFNCAPSRFNWTRNVCKPPAGTPKLVPSGKEIEAPGTSEIGAKLTATLTALPPLFAMRTVRIAEVEPSESTGPNETDTRPGSSVAKAISEDDVAVSASI